MDFVALGKTGERRVGGFVEAELRLGPYAEQIVNDVGLGRFFEAARWGRIFHLNNTAQTIAATHNSPLAAATATPIVGVINPVNSGKAAAILSGWMTSISGTPPANANPSWNFATAIQSISTNPAGSVQPGLINGANQSVMDVYNNVALTGLGVATGQVGLLRHFGGAPFAGALAANHDQGWWDNVDGAIIVPPGTGCIMLAGAAPGTSWVVSAGMTWAEVDWPLG